MFLHLGEDTVITDESIIGIFDIDNSTVNKATRDYLSKAEKDKRVVYVNYDLPKSFIVTDNKVYISPINTSTLNRRASKLKL
ncbi:MAG: extracellular matrix regulator RemB [Eubacterium sp.]